VVQGRQPEAFQVLDHELGELPAGHRRKQGRWLLAIQDEPEVVQLAPGHGGDWSAHELLMRPSEVQTRRIAQLPGRAIAAMQLRRERDGTSQAFVHLPEPLFLRCRARPAEDGDQVEVAASRLVVTSGQ
jgi:hypothetical protein